MPVHHDRAAAIIEAWGKERPDLDTSSVEVITRVWQLAKVFGDRRREMLRAHALEPALLDLLGTLRRSGEPYALTTRELAAHSGVTTAAISQRLSRAEQRGWIQRRPGDKRTVIVALTQSGLTVIDTAAAGIFTHDDTLLAALDEPQQRTLADLLGILVRDLDDRTTLPPLGAD